MLFRRSMLALAALPAGRRAAGSPAEPGGGGVSAGSPATAAEAGPPALSPAQVVLFETPHLASVRPPVRLDYAFRRDEAGKPTVEDSIRLAVRASAEKGRRDVAVEFLTGARAIRYPPATGFRGNPLLLFALDRQTRELSAATGGSATWFRNRIRRALAGGAELRPATVELDGRPLAATEILLTPFAGEPRAGRYRAMRFAVRLAEEVPGRIHAIRTDLPAGEDGGAVAESIVFTGAAPLPEAPEGTAR